MFRIIGIVLKCELILAGLSAQRKDWFLSSDLTLRNENTHISQDVELF